LLGMWPYLFNAWEQTAFYSQFFVNVFTSFIDFPLEQPLLMHFELCKFPVLEYAVVLGPMHSPTRGVVSWRECNL